LTEEQIAEIELAVTEAATRHFDLWFQEDLAGLLQTMSFRMGAPWAVMESRDDARSFYERSFLRFDYEQVSTSGWDVYVLARDLAGTRGTHTLTQTDSTGTVVNWTARFNMVWVLEDDGWRLLAAGEHWRSD
jgi:hypothetical protein